MNQQAKIVDDIRRQKIILKYYPLVKKIAGKLAKNYPRSVQIHDLIQVGVVGLIDAIDRYDEQLSASFETYLRIRIQGAILDDRRAKDWIPRSVRDRAQVIHHAKEQLQSKLKRTPSREEMANFLQLTPEKLDRMFAFAEVKLVLSTEHGIEANQRLGDTLPAQHTNPQSALLEKEQKERVQSKLKTLTEREQLIIQLHYYEHQSFHQISKKLGVSVARVSQIHAQIKRKMSLRLV